MGPICAICTLNNIAIKQSTFVIKTSNNSKNVQNCFKYKNVCVIAITVKSNYFEYGPLQFIMHKPPGALYNLAATFFCDNDARNQKQR